MGIPTDGGGFLGDAQGGWQVGVRPAEAANKPRQACFRRRLVCPAESIGEKSLAFSFHQVVPTLGPSPISRKRLMKGLSRPWHEWRRDRGGRAFARILRPAQHRRPSTSSWLVGPALQSIRPPGPLARGGSRRVPGPEERISAMFFTSENSTASSFLQYAEGIERRQQGDSLVQVVLFLGKPAQYGSSSRRARARDSASGIGSGSIRISRVGRSFVRVKSTLSSVSPGLIKRPKNRNPSLRAKRNTEPWRNPPSANRPSAAVLVVVRSGVAGLENLDAGHQLALPVTTCPLIVRGNLCNMGSKTRGFSPIVIQSDRIGSVPDARITTRYDDPTRSLSGIWKEPSAAVRTGPPLNPTGFRCHAAP